MDTPSYPPGPRRGICCGKRDQLPYNDVLKRLCMMSRMPDSEGVESEQLVDVSKTERELPVAELDDRPSGVLIEDLPALPDAFRRLVPLVRIHLESRRSKPLVREIPHWTASSRKARILRCTAASSWKVDRFGSEGTQPCLAAETAKRASALRSRGIPAARR
jgi:hypothetical protein